MKYAKQTWADGDPTKPLSAARMQHIEDGLDAVANGGFRTVAAVDTTGVTDAAPTINALISAYAAGTSPYSIIELPTGTIRLNSAIDFSPLKGTNKGMTLQGGGSGNLFTSVAAATLIKNYNAGPAIKGYGTLAGGVATPIVSLNLKGFMIQNQQNIGASNYTIDIDYCVNGMLWEDVYVYGQNFTGNGIQVLNTANGGFVMQYVIARGFQSGVGHYDGSAVTANVDVAPNSGNGIKIGCQSVDALVHFRVNQAGGNLFNSTSFISCKAVNVSDVVGSIDLDLQTNGNQTFISAFHSERNAIGIQDASRGTTCMSPMITYPSGTPWLTTGSITSGSAALTVADGQYWANGDRITVAGAGAAGATLTTTVSSGGGTTSLTLAATASTTVSGGNVGGTDACFRFLSASWSGEYRGARLHGLAYGARYESGARGHQVSYYDAGLTVAGATGASQAANETQVVTQFGRTGISTSAKRDEAMRKGRQIIAATVDRNLCSTSYTLSSGSLQGIAVGLIAGEIVTGIGLELTNVPTLLTLAQVALYDKSGNRLAFSADQSADWMAAGTVHKDIAFSAPYQVVADDLYYLCILCIFTGTAPTIARTAAPGAQVAGGVTNSGVRTCVGQGSLASLPNPATFGAGQGGFLLEAY